MESRIEALVENIAMAVMQADHLAADALEYGVLAETLAYALHQIPRPRVATTRWGCSAPDRLAKVGVTDVFLPAWPQKLQDLVTLG